MARVDSTVVAARDLRAFAEGMSAKVRPTGTPTAVRHAYLRSLLATHVLALEAHARGLDTLARVRQEVDRRWRQHLITLYRRELLSAPVTVPDEDVQQYISEHQLKRLRKVAGILVKERALAQDIRSRLQAGASFAALARQYSIDKRSADQGGVLGYVSRRQALRLKIPAALFDTLATGALSPVLGLGENCQVIRFEADSSLADSSLAPRVRDALRSRVRAALQERRVQQQADQLRWRVEPGGLNLLLELAKGHTHLLGRQLSPPDLATPVFVYDGGIVTIGGYLTGIWQRPLQALNGWGLRDSSEVVEAADELVRPPAMMYEAARHAGIGERPQEQAWLAEVTREYAIRELRKLEATDKTDIDDDDARAYYEQHRDLFGKAGTITIAEVLVEDEATAHDVRAAVDQGESITDLAGELSVRETPGDLPGVLFLDEAERLSYPRLYAAAAKADSGEVVGPIEVKGGYSVFMVIDHGHPSTESFEDSRRRAAALARYQQRDRLFDDLVDHLMDRYGNRMVIYQNELKAALPDSLLQRLQPAPTGQS